MRKALASILRKSRPGERLNEHLEHFVSSTHPNPGRKLECAVVHRQSFPDRFKIRPRRIDEGPMAPRAELYEYHARECDLAASRTDNPKRREMFLKLAREWRLDILRSDKIEEAA